MPRHATPARNWLRVLLFSLLLSLLLPGCMTRRTTSPLESPARPESATKITAAATPPSAHDLYGPFMRNDTLFLRDWQQTDTTDGLTYYCRVFVEKTTPESAHSSLSQQWEPDYWRDNLAILKKRHPAPFPTHDLHDCPTTWLPITSFQGTLYIDMAFEGPIWLSDSLLVRQTHEGPWPTPLQSVERPGKRHYRLLTTDSEQFDIYITDTVRQLAVFAFRNSDNFSYQSLYAPLETASRLDLVVWDCSEIPDYHDVSWDQPNYKALISAATNKPHNPGTHSSAPSATTNSPDNPGTHSSTPSATTNSPHNPGTHSSTPSATTNSPENLGSAPSTATNNPQNEEL